MIRHLFRIVALTTLLAGLASARAEELDVIRTGHWVEVRGQLDADGRFVASAVELVPPDEHETLIGTAAGGARKSGRFFLLGQEVHTSVKTKWGDRGYRDVVGERIKVEGVWRGPRKLSARKVSPRGAGRDRIIGRVDAIRDATGGLELHVMRFVVFLADDLDVEHELPLAEIPRAPATALREVDWTKDEDDQFGEGFALRDDLLITGQLQLDSTFEREFDLDRDDPEDRDDYGASARLRAEWTPSTQLRAMAEVRHARLWRNEESDPDERRDSTRLGETYLQWNSASARGLAVRAGRQDFDDAREWVYDQNLDAVRFLAARPGLEAELAIGTTFTAGSPRDRNSVVTTGYLSNGDRRRTLAAWFLHRNATAASGTEERLTHVGARLLGRWVPRNDLWLDLAYVGGTSGGTDVSAFGYDVGTTWKPKALAPLRFTVGYALGRGDDGSGSTDGTFRQTGLQDNTAKFGGVTSFRYYGELFDPELSNLGILTVGAGIDLPRKTSLDLVFHQYTQDVAQPFLLDSDLDDKPNGTDPDLGFELDLVFGTRRFAHWDVEVVGSWFHPLDAFTNDDDAYLAKLQLRYRF
jgi:hypothetical protein